MRDCKIKLRSMSFKFKYNKVVVSCPEPSLKMISSMEKIDNYEEEDYKDEVLLFVMFGLFRAVKTIPDEVYKIDCPIELDYMRHLEKGALQKEKIPRTWRK